MCEVPEGTLMDCRKLKAGESQLMMRTEFKPMWFIGGSIAVSYVPLNDLDSAFVNLRSALFQGRLGDAIGVAARVHREACRVEVWYRDHNDTTTTMEAMLPPCQSYIISMEACLANEGVVGAVKNAYKIPDDASVWGGFRFTKQQKAGYG